MPRAAKTTTRKHAAAVALPKRSFAAPEAVEKVLPGSVPEQTLSSVAAPPPPKPLFASKVFHGAIAAGAAAHPYSRSHLRREKRKAKQQLAGGGLTSVADALAEVSEPTATTTTEKKGKKNAPEDIPQKRKAEPDGKIGEGSTKTVGEKSRRKQIAANARRIPAVMSHPAFKANPWATIREHAANTLAVAEDVKAVQERKIAEAKRVEQREQVAIPSGMVGIE